MKQLVARRWRTAARLSTSCIVPTGLRRPTRSWSWRRWRARGGVYFSTSDRRARGSSSRSTRCSRCGAREHSGGGLAFEDRVQGEFRQDARSCAASRRRGRVTDVTANQYRTRARRMASTPACLCGRAKAGSTGRCAASGSGDACPDQKDMTDRTPPRGESVVRRERGDGVMLSSVLNRSCGSTKPDADADWKAMAGSRDAVIDLVIADHGERPSSPRSWMKTMCGRR